MLSAQLVIQGAGWWTPRCTGWPAARQALATGRWPDGPVQRPTTALLAANERRRAPDAVLMALQVADEACRAAGVDRATVASVFTSAHGDLAIVDALCRTLAEDPALLSPMRFHHSVHNAAAGYWAIAAGNREAGIALAAGEHSFAQGLLEAISQCVADQRPVLLVGCDTEAVGALRSVNRSRGWLALALLLAPVGATSGAGRGLAVSPAPASAARPMVPPLPADLRDNAMSPAVPLFAALAGPEPAQLALALGGPSAIGLRLAAA